jgi:ABC-type Fe3+ transport system permease subunit
MIQLFTTFAADKCSHFLTFPTWYEYIHDPGNCKAIQITGINDVWLIVAAVIEILLRVAGIFAVVFIMYGGFQYLTSQAEPDKVNKAKHTIINALVGLIIAILASVIINFIARSIT